MVYLDDALFMPALIGIQGKASDHLLDNEVMTLCLQAFSYYGHMLSLITNDWC